MTSPDVVPPDPRDAVTVPYSSPLRRGTRTGGRGMAAGIAMRLVRSRPLLLVVLILLLSAYMTIEYPQSFPTFSNFSAVLLNAAQYGILVVGTAILMIGGAFDLSIGSTLALCGVVAGQLIAIDGFPTPIGIALALVAGCIAGLVNGLIVTKVRINPLIATLATQGIFRGITQLISGTGIDQISNSFATVGQTVWFGLQTPFWVMLVIVVAGSWAVGQTRFFRQYYYVGGNERAARLSGMKTDRLILIAFVLMGFLAGVAGVLNAARLDAAVVSAGIGVELQVITAAVLGGASLKGGEGTVPGAFLGVLFIALVQNALIILNVDVFWQNIVIGSVLLLAVSLDRWKHVSRK
jgi:ribose transport system permease protein